MEHIFTLFFDILVGFCLGAMAGFIVGRGGQLLDFMMDYGHYFWKVRYWIAKQYAKKTPGLSFELYRNLYQSKYGYDSSGERFDGIALMNGMYHDISDKHPMFKRWLCTICMSVYLSLYALIVGAVIIVFFCSIQAWAIVLVYMISLIAWTYQFSKY